VAPPVFKIGLAANIVAGGFDSLPPPPTSDRHLIPVEVGKGESGVVLIIKMRLIP
jgi:hypothetical protein